MKHLNAIGVLIFVLGTPFFLFELYRLLPTTTGTVPTPSYAETTTIVLAALTIVLGLIALIVAFLAFWGYQGIKTMAERRAEEAVRAAIAERIDTVAFRRTVQKEVRRIHREELDLMALKYSRAFTDSESIGQQSDARHVGEEYPDK